MGVGSQPRTSTASCASGRRTGDASPQQLLGHEYQVVAVAWSPDGRQIASGGADATIRIWSAGDVRASGAAGAFRLIERARVESGRSPARLGRPRPDGARWDIGGAGDPRILEGHGDRVTAVAWSPDGRRITSSGEDGTVRIWDPDSSPDPLYLRNPSGAIGSLSWSPDGRRIASSSWDRFVRIWDADSGDPIRTLACGPSGGHCVAWSPDGSRLAANRDDGHVTVWGAADGRPVLDLRWEGKVVVSLAWSPDGRRLAAAGWDKVVRIWAADGSPSPDPMVLRGHGTRLHALAWSRDGSRLASAGEDGSVCIWDPEAGRSVRLLAGHSLASRARVESGRPPACLGWRGYDHPDLGPRDRRRSGRLAAAIPAMSGRSPGAGMIRGWRPAATTASCALGHDHLCGSSPSGTTPVRSTGSPGIRIAAGWPPPVRAGLW